MKKMAQTKEQKIEIDITEDETLATTLLNVTIVVKEPKKLVFVSTKHTLMDTTNLIIVQIIEYP